MSTFIRELEEYFDSKLKDLHLKSKENKLSPEEMEIEEYSLLRIEEELEFLYTMEQ